MGRSCRCDRCRGLFRRRAPGSYRLGESIHRRRLEGACREGLDGRDVAAVAPTPVDRSKLDMSISIQPLAAPAVGLDIMSDYIETDY